MPYKYCKQCKKRISNKLKNEFCDDSCKNIYISSSDVHCKMCNSFIGKSSVTSTKTFCNLTCSNLYQKEINKVERECIYCGEKFIVQRSSHRYKLCSDVCEKKYISSDERNKKRMSILEKNNLKKYGVKYTFQLKEVINKGKNTKLKKYGNLNNYDKIKNTKLEKYGDEHYLNRDLAKKTKLEKYGTLNFNEKANKTKLEKYGTLNFSEKVNKTKLEKYGTLNFSEKANKTKVEKYGSLSNLYLSNSYVRLKNKYEDIVEFHFSEKEYNGAKEYVKYEFKCKKCNLIFQDNMTNGSFPKCPECHPCSISKFEDEIFDYIKNSNIIRNDRKILDNFELDLVLPDYNLAIECNGVYWHSEISGGKNRYYHLNKTNQCKEKNIKLIHIMDYEWLEKQEIVKSIISNKLNKSNVIYARKCNIKVIDSKIKNKFLYKNHIQGEDKSNIKLGLYYNNELVSVMTFVKSRFDKKYQYELSRYCNRLYTTVIGGASKLFKHFINNYEVYSIVTYSDKRFFDGKLYENIGMTFVNDTPPNFYYFNKNKIPMSRMKFQKHKLPKLLENFDPSLSEWKNMQMNGFDRIWDCGNLKYEWIRK